VKSTFRFIILSFLVLGCLGSAFLWHQARSLSCDREKSISMLESHCEAARARFARLSQELASLETDTKTALEEPSYKLKLELEQWNSRLQSHIEVLKEKRRLHPLSKRPLPPPIPANSVVFPELLADPEYYALARRYYRSMENLTSRPNLAFLKDLPADTREKALDLLAERSLSNEEAQGIVAERSGGLENVVPEEYMRVQSEIQERIKNDLNALLTPGDYTKINEFFDPSLRASGQATDHFGESILTSALRRRLSYTDTPLSRDFESQLTTRIQNISATPETRFGYNKIPDFIIEHYKALLSPEQALALDEIVAEKAAYQRREKLPKQ